MNDEYDVQDLFHALLATIFSDIRKEECAIIFFVAFLLYVAFKIVTSY